MASLWGTGLFVGTALMTAGCGDGNDSAEIEAPGVSIKAGPDGAEIRAPGVDIKAGPDGTQVSAPGVDIKAGPQGTEISAPGVDVKAGPQGTEVSAPGVDVQAGRDEVTAGVAGPVSNGADSQPLKKRTIREQWNARSCAKPLV